MIFEFGPFRYDFEQRLLFRGEDRVPLVPKVAETLHVLLERRGKVVEKAELMRLVWPGTTVEDVGLARNISLLRKTLGDDSEENPYIETIPRRGYRFAGAATLPEPITAAPVPVKRRWNWWWLGAPILAAVIYFQFYVPSKYLPERGGASAAVVPFSCLCQGGDGEAISIGFTDLLSAELSKSDTLQVIAPSTIRRHQKAGVSMGLMGRLLGLDALVEGTIQNLGSLFRVTVRLVDVHTGKIIWADSFDRPVLDLETARLISAEVGVRLSKH